MITVLQYLVIAAAIGLVVFLVAVLVFGRGEQMAPLPARTSPAELPDGGIAPRHIRELRFAVALRGYRMSDVDWSLEKVADEVERLRAEVTRLGGDPDRLPELPQQDLVSTPVDADGRDSGHEGDPDPDGAPTTVLRP